MQTFVFLLMTVPLGHWQRGTHCLVQTGLGVVQLAGQAEPQNVNSCPRTGHSQLLVTSFPLASKNLALHPPQKSDLHLALGWAGHFVNMQGSTKQFTRGFPGGQVGTGVVSGHSSSVTQEFEVTSMTIPLGHSQRATHCLVQMGLGVVQLAGQAEPQLVNIWPFTGQGATQAFFVHANWPFFEHMHLLQPSLALKVCPTL